MGMGDFLPPLLQAFGPWGLLIGYMVWQQIREDKRRDQEAADKKQAAADRIDVDKETNEERRSLGSALTALCMVVQGRPHV